MKIIRSIKCTICAIAAFFVATNVLASRPEGKPGKSNTYSASIYFATNESKKIDSLNQLEITNLILTAQRYNSATIIIYGWADENGNAEYNKKLSAARAATAKSYLEGKGIDSNRITCMGMGIDYDHSNKKARRSTMTIEILAMHMPQVADLEVADSLMRQPKITLYSDANPLTLSNAQIMESRASQEVINPKEKGNLELRTNLLYWLGGSINAGVEWNPAGTDLGVIVNGGYAPFGGNHWKNSLGGWFVSPEVRYYFGKEDRIFLGVAMLAGGYNFKLSDKGYQGNVFAGGITGGYKIYLSEIFDMDFSLGLGYGSLKYDTYFHENGVNYRNDKDLRKNTFMPIQTGVSLIWKICKL